MSHFLYRSILLNIGGIFAITWTTEGRTIAAQGKGLFFLKYLCVCCGKRKYCMGLDAFGCDRIYALVKGRIENIGGRSPLSNQFSLFITSNCFSISLPMGNIDTFGLTAHVLNIAVCHRYLKHMKAFILSYVLFASFPTCFKIREMTSQNNVHLSIYLNYLYVERETEKCIVRYNFFKIFQIYLYIIHI